MSTVIIVIVTLFQVTVMAQRGLFVSVDLGMR